MYIKYILSVSFSDECENRTGKPSQGRFLYHEWNAKEIP